MLCFIDIESTGLDPEKCAVLEIAVVLTDDALIPVARFHDVTDEAAKIPLADVHPVVQKMHRDNGLWMESAVGGQAQSLSTLDALLAANIWCVVAGLTPVDTQAWLEAEASGYQGLRLPELAGSSVHFDRAFLARHMPRTHAILHRRNLDVSSVGNLVQRAWPAIWDARPRGEVKHRAKDDIDHSIALLRYFRDALGPTTRIDATDS